MCPADRRMGRSKVRVNLDGVLGQLPGLADPFDMVCVDQVRRPHDRFPGLEVAGTRGPDTRLFAFGQAHLKLGNEFFG